MYNTLGEIAKYLNYLCFIFSVVSVLGYYKSIEDKKWLRIGFYSFNAMTISIILLFFTLLFLIVKHQYQYTYVFHNSSNELSFGLLLSSSYAGQEGSFLIWTLFLAVIGVFLVSFSRKHNCEAPVMGTFTFIIAFLLLLVINKSPFEKIWETFPESIRTGTLPKMGDIIALSSNSYFQLPPDGNGLNPLLQNFWMQIHPPILFLGFALMAVPFAFAIAALLQKNYQDWLNKALPWILSASSVLGLGIILGGFWAYETLGWGGYWGWDPVENSSLIPWLVSIALVHTAYTQKKTGGLIKTNLFLSLIGFILIIYSTFLTRSGVLSDSSVHSFTEPGAVVYLLLIIFLAVFILFGFILLFIRLKDITKINMEYNILSREVALSIGSLVILISAIVIFAGTSYPIIAKSNVDISFYNNWNLPLAIIMIFLNGFSLLLFWRENTIQQIFRKSIVSLLFSVIFTIITFMLGVKDLIFILLIWSSYFALILNIEKLFKVIMGTPIKSGAFVSHIGVAMLLLGIVGSGRYSESQNIKLIQNKPSSAFGYNFTYLGEEKFDNGKKSYFKVNIEKDGDITLLKPIMFISSMNNGIMKIPDIRTTVFKDIYFSPVSLEESNNNGNGSTLEIERGKQISFRDYKIIFLSHNFGEKSMNQMMTGDGFEIGAKIEIEYKNGDKEFLSLNTKYSDKGTEMISQKTKDNLLDIGLMKVTSNPTQGVHAILSISGSNLSAMPNEEILIAEVSIKPFILVFWIGNIIMLFGFMISILRRWKELKN